MQPENPDTIEIPIDGTLDLHNFLPKEIKSLVHEYLKECQKKDILSVRIVHGKGTGALRRTVHSALDKCSIVADYKLAGIDAGTWGATLVSLHPSAKK